MQVHALLAALIMPVAIMFFITGALYTWGIKGEFEVSRFELQLEQPLSKNLKKIQGLAEKELGKRHLAIPTGSAKIKNVGDSFRFEWSGSDINVILKPTSRPLAAKLEIKKANGYQRFVQLHKAKGSDRFKVYAAVLATGLMVLLITGFWMAWLTPKLRKAALISAVLGTAVFVAMVLSS